MKERLQDYIPKLVLSPSFFLILVFVYGFIAYTGYLSFTDSRILPSYNWVGLENYERLWKLPHWWRAITNLAIFGSLYILICSVLGLLLAILLDQKIRAEGLLRPHLSLSDGAVLHCHGHGMEMVPGPGHRA